MPTIHENTQLLIQAAERGDAAEVQRLIPISEPSFNSSWALQVAASDGYVDCVQLLIPVSEPKTKNSVTLRAAARSGHAQCVALLIPVSDPKVYGSVALRIAAENGHTQCVELLYPVSEPMVALKQLQHDHPDNYNKWGQLYEMVQAERLRNTLNSEVGITTVVKVQRKL